MAVSTPSARQATPVQPGIFWLVQDLACQHYDHCGARMAWWSGWRRVKATIVSPSPDQEPSAAHRRKCCSWPERRGRPLRKSCAVRADGTGANASSTRMLPSPRAGVAGYLLPSARQKRWFSTSSPVGTPTSSCTWAAASGQRDDGRADEFPELIKTRASGEPLNEAHRAHRNTSDMPVAAARTGHI